MKDVLIKYAINSTLIQVILRSIEAHLSQNAKLKQDKTACYATESGEVIIGNERRDSVQGKLNNFKN
jgi:hypothetical protein